MKSHGSKMEVVFRKFGLEVVCMASMGRPEAVDCIGDD